MMNRKRIQIEALKNSNGDWIIEDEQFSRHAIDHFHELFTEESVSPNLGLPNYFSRAAIFDFQALVRPASSEEVIVNTLQGYMAELVSPNQVSFVPGRHIQDNIVIAHELVHSMHRMRGRKKFMAIKVGLEKAYDRLNWNFIVDTLVAAWVPEKLQVIIRDCISSVGTNVLWNGNLTEGFKPRRGIRQGCPLSLYLFVLCVERLSHLIRESVEVEVWQPIRVGRNGQWISHLMFADDILLFAKVSENQIAIVCAILDRF
ncbi:hypothetical protein CRG98_047515 [Punica granatum]|uniref:Reverse transcriptase domain-containing protein n=1 Tax=Punica granatum TaxID=22663 RepID=A0A2I0HKH4_PUNGR|nr:hypothetical protein CRG98_047515 [Punica granatum]